MDNTGDVVVETGGQGVCLVRSSVACMLTGGTGNDRFVLGNASGRFYDDGSTATKGTGDYALITDFTVGSDVLQLDGAAGNYYLGVSPVAGVSGSALFFENGTNDELVAITRSGDATAVYA